MRITHGDLVIVAELLPRRLDGKILEKICVGGILIRPYKGEINE